MEDLPESRRPVQDVLERIEDLADLERLTLRDLIEAFGTASFVPALMVPAILVVSPLSGIPLFSSVCGLTIALVALQMLLRRDHLWLPGFLMRRTVNGERLTGGMRRLHRIAAWIDRYSRKRLHLLTVGPGIAVPQTLSMVSGASMPFLELLPFSSSILGTAVLLFSVSFLAFDGLFVLGGMVMMGIAAMVPLFVISQVAG